MGAVFEKEYGSVEWIKRKPNGEEFRNDRILRPWEGFTGIGRRSPGVAESRGDISKETG
jgi:hypothetical protein